MIGRLLVILSVAGLGFSAWAQDIKKAVLLDKSVTWNGARIEYPTSGCPEVQAVVVKIPGGNSTGIHLHPVNNYAYVLKGSVHLEVGDVGADGRFIKNVNYRQADFKEGEAFAEVVNAWHNGTAGPEGVEILVWYTTAAGQPVSVAYATAPDYKNGKAPAQSSACKPTPRHADENR